MSNKNILILLALTPCHIFYGLENQTNPLQEQQPSQYEKLNIQERLGLLDAKEAEYRKEDATKKLNGRNVTIAGYFTAGALFLASLAIKNENQRAEMQIAALAITGVTSLGGAGISLSDSYKYSDINDEKRTLITTYNNNKPPFTSATVFLSNPIQK